MYPEVFKFEEQETGGEFIIAVRIYCFRKLNDPKGHFREKGHFLNSARSLDIPCFRGP